MTNCFLSLQPFKFEVRHHPGKQHLNADALSRRFVRPSPPRKPVVIIREEVEENREVGNHWRGVEDCISGQMAPMEVGESENSLDKVSASPDWLKPRGEECDRAGVVLEDLDQQVKGPHTFERCDAGASLAD